MNIPSLILTLPEAAYTPVGAEVLRGLTATPKTLSPWLFYDEAGSKLFEAITRLPEYYLTRTERGIFAKHADAMLESGGDGTLKLIELGAGTAVKTGLLLQAAIRRQGKVEYVPIDVSESALAQAKARLESEINGVTCTPRVADYTDGIAEVPAAGARRMVLYIGSSIGNFEPEDAVTVLREVRKKLTVGDRLLLGADHVKDRQTLLRAYDDEAGITAEFNKNLLVRINRELGGNFNARLFRHRARWNERKSRIEIHLESVTSQVVTVPALELEVRFGAGETIHTENSYKFTAESIAEIVERAGFRMERRWTDEREWFGVYLATAG
ncbi:MAG TPA: L-histidine N(alpha)-methyltransferase [Acidobacteriaceae bacterium]|nr:L-histidine N(alpha)-methyltransferase [Acidobacteriaceae bacterium]